MKHHFEIDKAKTSFDFIKILKALLLVFYFWYKEAYYVLYTDMVPCDTTIDSEEN